MTDMFNAVPVSVCVPIYNGALYIRDAVRSVLNQTVMPQEIIISDSGSSDGSEDIAREETRRTQVNVIILPTKTPDMVANWNSTIRAASGKYIKFLFQDDLLHPYCLEEMVKVAECDERIGFVFSPRELLIEPSAEGDEITKWLLRYRNLSAAFGELKASQPGSLLLRSPELLQEPLNKIGEPTAVLIRTSMLREAGLFNEGMCQLVDMEMWVRLMAISHVGYVSKALASVRVHPQRASNRHTSEEIVRFERDCLCDTLRTAAIYPLLHWRVRCALRFAQVHRHRLFASRITPLVQRLKGFTEKLQILAQFSAKEKLYILISALLRRAMAKIPADHQNPKAFFVKLRAAGHDIKKIKDTNLVTIRGDADLGDYCFLVRRRISDVQVAQQVLMQKDYQPLVDLIFRQRQQQSIEYVVDAGANVGYATIFFKKLFPRSACFPVEPDPGNYGLLLENIRVNNLENVFPVKASLWTSAKRLTISRSFRDGKEWSISVTETDTNCIGTTKGITVGALMEEHLLPRIDVLKMDIEGAEALIFSRDAHPEHFLPKVRFLALEIHEEKGAREQMLDMLRESEFEMSFYGGTVFGLNRNFLRKIDRSFYWA
jgi:FkbM family methyltransferase